MRIVLDTNIIVGDYRLKGTAARVLLQQLPRSSHQLHMPQTVIDEALNKYRGEWEHYRRSTDKLRREAQKRVKLDIPSAMTSAEVDVRTDEYKHELDQILVDVGATIVPYPKTPHEKLALRAMERQKPFSESGTGYRDALIWETVLDILDGTDEVVALITEDRDFADKNREIYPNLLEDLTARGFGHDRVRIYRSLDEFVEQELKPDFKRLEDIRARLDAAEYPGLDLASVIETRLEYADLPVIGRGVEPDVGLPDCVENPTLAHAAINDIVEDISVLDVWETPAGELLIELEADAAAQFDFFIFKSDWWGVDPAKEDIWVIDDDWNDHYIFAEAVRPVHLNVSLTFDPTSSEVTSVELNSIMAVAGEGPD